MFKPTPNPPETDTGSEASLEAEKLKEAADRVFSYYFPPHEKPGKRRKHHLFSVSPDIDTEALLANASEDLLSISAIAADLVNWSSNSGHQLRFHAASFSIATGDR